MNKCAADKKDTSLKLQYLTNIKNEVNIDKAKLEANLIDIGNKIETLNTVLPKLNTNAPDKIMAARQIFSVFTLTDFHPKDITYQTMINSGDLKLIDNFEIKTAIETHYSNYKTILKDYERQEIIHKEYLGSYLINKTNYDVMRRGELGFEDEKLLKNILQSMNGSFYIKKAATERGIKSCDSLLNVLENSK